MPTTEESEVERNKRTLLDRARTTPDDLYALLSIPSPVPPSTPSTSTPSTPTTHAPASAAAIKKAYRTAALKHHPDKNPNNATAAATFDALNKAYEILADPAARDIYDARQAAAAAKAERTRAFDGRRRRMKEELERRESAGRRASGGVVFADADAAPSPAPATPAAGVKRKFGGSPAGAPMDERQEAELRRLAAEGARRRAEQQEKLRRQRQEEAREQGDGDSGGEEKGRRGGGGVAAGGTPARSFKFSTPTSGAKVGIGVGGTPRAGDGVGGTKAPSLFESTMQRLREAEKKRQQQQQNAAAATGNGEAEATPAAAS